MRQSGRELELHFVGVSGRSAVESLLASQCPLLARHARFIDRLPNDQAAIELSRANVFVTFNNYATVGTKIYDYLVLEAQNPPGATPRTARRCD